MSDKTELPALPTFGWIIDAGIEPWIDVWAVVVLSQRIREKRPRSMREAHRIQYRYQERLWSFLIPEEHLKDKADGRSYEIGRSQVCLSSNELRNKFEEIYRVHGQGGASYLYQEMMREFDEFIAAQQHP
jgi:hypothetical protein